MQKSRCMDSLWAHPTEEEGMILVIFRERSGSWENKVPLRKKIIVFYKSFIFLERQGDKEWRRLNLSGMPMFSFLTFYIVLKEKWKRKRRGKLQWMRLITQPMPSFLPPQRVPSAGFLCSKWDLFSLSAVSGSCWRQQHKGPSQQLISPQTLRGSSQDSGPPTTYMTKKGTCWLHFTPTSPVLSFQEVYFSATSTVYFG